MQNVNDLQFLSDDALGKIESTAYRLLDEVGIDLDHSEAKEMLHGLGCRVEDDRTHIPADVVEWALENVTPHRDLYNADGSLAFSLDGQCLRFHNGGGPPSAYDLESGKRRPATLKDVVDMTRLLDALPHVDIVIPLFGPQDVPPPLLPIASTEATLRNTRKPVSPAAVDKPEHVDYIVQMAAACCGGMEAYRRHPTMTISVSPVSPLKFSAEITASMIAVVTSGSPFYPLPAPIMGATSPITMAGALTQQHAEVLASLVIAAAVRPGAPVGYCSRISPIDLRTAVSAWGGPEVGMTGACAAQLAHRMGLTCDSYGLSTSATQLDPQFAYERLGNLFPPALAGVDILSGVGTTDSGLAGACEIAVIDDEIISLLKHLIRGCAVNDDTLAFDVMREVIPRDGVFLGEKHTVRHVREGALTIPRLGAWSTLGDSEPQGVVARAKSRAKHILNTHRVEPLADAVSQQLDQIMDRARRELVGSQTFARRIPEQV
jgi:trimethylamine--corrinoid protein Co-methyltransferase